MTSVLPSRQAVRPTSSTHISPPSRSEGRIRVGIGGWNYQPWHDTFYPAGTPKSRELEYASRQVTTIEVNGTFYRLQSPAIFAKWRETVPDDFVFSLKAPRFIVQRKQLATAAAAIDKFISSGITELDAKLGPILWQLAPTKRFDPEDLEGFLKLLPRSAGTLSLRHALEVRHDSFLNANFLAIARAYSVAVVFEDDESHPACADLTSTFVYARLRRSVSTSATGYAAASLKKWAARARKWAQGKEPSDLPRLEHAVKALPVGRDVFVYFINGAKERAPAAARELLSQLA